MNDSRARSGRRLLLILCFGFTLASPGLAQDAMSEGPMELPLEAPPDISPLEDSTAPDPVRSSAFDMLTGEDTAASTDQVDDGNSIVRMLGPETQQVGIGDAAIGGPLTADF